MASKKITRQLSIFINGKEVKNSLGAIGREISKVKRKLKEANDPKDIQKYKAELDKLGKAYGEVKNEIDDQNISLQEAQSHFQNIFQGALLGDVKLLSAGVKGVVGNIKGMTKAALAFIATPLGIALTAVVAIGAGIKKWVDYNLEIEKTNQLVRDLTQETGIAVDKIRVRAEVLQKTFETDINKSVTTAKSLVKSFGITYNQAFDLIEDGAIRGKLKNDEFLDSLKEYPIQFKNAGFSAEEFISIVNTGIDLSIYTDKLPDAIKEFNLSITEQTQASKEALQNAFGKEFTNKLLKDLSNGAITAKEALALISAEAERIGLNSQQAQQLTADLFKGAGEDAGGALKIFEAVNIALNKQKKPLTEIQQIQKQQLKTNKELKGVYSQLFASGSKGFNLWIQKGKLFATRTILRILKGGVDLYNWFIDLNNESGAFSAILKSLGIIATSSFEVIGILVSGAWDSFKGLGNIVAGVFTLDWDRIKKGFNQGAQGLGNIITKMKNKAINDTKEIVDAWNGNNKKQRISLDNFLTDDSDIPKTEPVSDPIENTSNLNTNGSLTPEDQRILDSKKKLGEFLDEWEKDRELQKEIENLDKITQEEEKEIFDLEKKLAKMEEEAGVLGLKEEELSKTDRKLKERLEKFKQEGIAAIRKKYADKRLDEQKKEQKTAIDQDKKFKEAQIRAEEELQNARRQAFAVGIDILQSFVNKSSGIYKALFAIEKISAAANVIVDGVKERAKISAKWGAIPAVAGPMLLASKLRTGTRLVQIASTAIKGFHDGGPTGDKALYHDGEDGVAGVVHVKEWVAPRWQREHPRYAPVIDWLERERKKGPNSSYKDGGNVTDRHNSTEPEEELTIPVPAGYNEEIRPLLTALLAQLQKGIKAYLVRDYASFLEQKQIDEDHDQVYQNTRQ